MVALARVVDELIGVATEVARNPTLSIGVGWMGAPDPDLYCGGDGSTAAHISSGSAAML